MVRKRSCPAMKAVNHPCGLSNKGRIIIPAVSHYNNAQPPIVSIAARQAAPAGSGKNSERTHNLQLDRLSLKLYCPNLKVDTDRRDIAFCVSVVRKTEEQARLADTGVAWVALTRMDAMKRAHGYMNKGTI